MEKKKQEGGTRKKREEGDHDTKTTVIIPFINGVSYALSQVFSCLSVAMTMKPHLTLKKILVHPKDKRTPQ